MRTDCNNPIIDFTPLARRQVTARFDAGAISSDGGVILLREVDRRIRLLDRVDSVIPDPRDPFLVEHKQRTLLAQRVMAIACGWEDLNDHATLRNDLVFQLATNRKASGRKRGRGDVDPERPLASAPTLCRLENRVDRRACVEINKLLVELFIESHRTAPKEVVLDFDATDDPIHGKQEGRFFHGYYDQYCFLPLYIFAGEQLLCAYLRPSNIDGAKHAWAILALIAKRLRQAWPNVKIIFRGDSGFCRWKMLRWCDRHGVDFPHITHKRFVNHLILCFDNKHRYAQKMRSLRMFQNNRLIAPTFWQLENTFRSFANTIFKHLRPRIMIPTIDRFQFQWSPAEFGLQAADLFSHLTFNAIKHDLGIVNQNTSLKARLLKQAMPTFSVDDALKAELQVTKNPRGEQDISCLNNKMRSRMQFLPA